MDQQRFLAEVSSRGGFDDVSAAERATLATLRALGARLHELDAQAIADDLPPKLAGPLRRDDFDGAFDLDGFYERVAAYEKVSPGRALEHAQVVCRVLGESLSNGAWKHLLAHLDDDWRALFVSPARAAPPPRAPRPRGTGTAARRTLSSGRPGAVHPLSDADGPVAHPGSVLRDANPHGETKLSSARGTAGEQRGHTLARGRPGSTHPVSESGEE